MGSVYSGNRVYARRTDESTLYAIRQVDAMQFPTEAFELRDRKLWQFNPPQVLSVSVSYKGQSRKISRGPGGGWVTSPAYAAVTPAILDETLLQFGQLQALAWVARGESNRTTFGFSDVAHQLSIEVKSGDKSVTLTLNFGQISPWNSPYASTTIGGETLVFGISAKVYDLYELVLRELRLVSTTP